jgi:hypothetical protein
MYDAYDTYYIYYIHIRARARACAPEQRAYTSSLRPHTLVALRPHTLVAEGRNIH